MSVLYATRTVSDAFWVRAISIAWLSATCACSDRSTPTRIFVNIACLLGIRSEREDHPDCGACRVYRRRASADVRWLRARPLVARLREPSALSSVGPRSGTRVLVPARQRASRDRGLRSIRHAGTCRYRSDSLAQRVESSVDGRPAVAAGACTSGQSAAHIGAVSHSCGGRYLRYSQDDGAPGKRRVFHGGYGG